MFYFNRKEIRQSRSIPINSNTIHLITFHRIIKLASTLINPLNPEFNPICYLLALLGGHHFLHVSRIRVILLTFRRLMSYIYIYMTLVA